MCWCKHNALRLSIRTCIHQPEQLGILRKIVVEGHDRLRHDQQSAADLCILDVPLFLVGDVQQPRQIVGIVGRLVQQLDVSTVGQHSARILVVQNRAHVLGDRGQNRTPLAGAAGQLKVKVRAILVAQQLLELVGKHPGTAAQHAVSSNAVSNLIQHRQHTDGLHRLAQLDRVEADAMILHVHIGLVGKQVHGATYI